MEHDLVDELRLLVHPLVLGSDRRLLSDTGRKHLMRLAETEVVGDGVVPVTYRRAG